MPISINGSGSITGINAGGLPDASVTVDDIASGAVTPAKLSTGGPNWDSSGRLLVGTSSSASSGYAQYAKVQVNASTLGSSTEGVLALTHGISASTSIPAEEGVGIVTFANGAGGEYARIRAVCDGTSSSASDLPGRLVFSTTADGASSPTERMRIDNVGRMLVGATSNGTYATTLQVKNNHDFAASFYNAAGQTLALWGSASVSSTWGSGDTINYVSKNTTTGRSIAAAGTVNASGADYAEYMIKDGQHDIAKGDICGITSNGRLTTSFSQANSFVVKSTNPSYVGNDNWATEDTIGIRPDESDVAALLQWKADLEAARQKVDRIAFAGQVPVNVTGATPGQYIVPVEAADGGIEGVAKHEADLTLSEYMRAVGKVIAIENDGRARIIVKVA